MNHLTPPFGPQEASDEQLAGAVARRLDVTLPVECVRGVAFNARLLQQHADVLLKAAS